MRRGRSGFTLLEMLLALALFAMLVGLIWGSYTAATRTVARCQKGFTPIHEGIKIQKILSRLLASASASRQKNPKATFTGEQNRVALTTLDRQGMDAAHPWPLAYVQIVHAADEGLSIVSHPTYFLLDKDDPSRGQKQVFQVVRKLELGYWDGSDFVHEWEAARKGKLPRRVKVEMMLSGEATADVPWAFDVLLPTQSDLPITGAVIAPGGVLTPGPGGMGPVPGVPPGTDAGGTAPAVPGMPPGQPPGLGQPGGAPFAF